MKIINLRVFENGQWSWTIDGLMNYNGDYCTNQSGDGLFADKSPGWTAHQITGTCQFSLAGCTKPTARQRIRKYFAEDKYCYE